MNATSPAMIKPTRFKDFAAALLALCASAPDAFAGDPVRDIVNALDPRSMNELFDVARAQPDAALTNIVPASANTFRFLFVWPSSNPVMTYNRVERSFAERFAYFAEQWKLLATGFCLSGSSLSFGSAAYGEEMVNVAYRTIEVRYAMGPQVPCKGRYVSLAEVESSLNAAAAGGSRYSVGPLTAPSQHLTAPQDGLKPFLNPAPSAPPE